MTRFGPGTDDPVRARAVSRRTFPAGGRAGRARRVPSAIRGLARCAESPTPARSRHEARPASAARTGQDIDPAGGGGGDAKGSDSRRSTKTSSLIGARAPPSRSGSRASTRPTWTICRESSKSTKRTGSGRGRPRGEARERVQELREARVARRIVAIQSPAPSVAVVPVDPASAAAPRRSMWWTRREAWLDGFSVRRPRFAIRQGMATLSLS